MDETSQHSKVSSNNSIKLKQDDEDYNPPVILAGRNSIKVGGEQTALKSNSEANSEMFVSSEEGGKMNVNFLGKIGKSKSAARLCRSKETIVYVPSKEIRDTYETTVFDEDEKLKQEQQEIQNLMQTAALKAQGNLLSSRRSQVSRRSQISRQSLTEGNSYCMFKPQQSPVHRNISFNVAAKMKKDIEKRDEREEWDFNYAKLVYLISLYANQASTSNEKETWLRQLSLNVLIFEGIVNEVFDYDYAPCSRLVYTGGCSRRIWINITQEGASAVEDLQERKLLNVLKLSTEDFQPLSAYQVTFKGHEFLTHVPSDLKKQVDDVFVKNGKVISIDFDGEKMKFYLTGGIYGEGKTESSVTDTEDTSYVSSPFLPASLRQKSCNPFTSNSHRAHECATGKTNINDELDEAVTLKNVNTLVAEWIPFGANQIVSLNEKLGALDRCQGGLFTAMVDESPTDTKFSVPAGLTSVKISDYDFVRHINFEAEIHYPEAEGIIQIENFGMHLNVSGTIFYGIAVEAVMDRKRDSISVDLLSRVLVDIHQDSSMILNDLLSQFQRSLIDCTFNGDALARNKFNCIMADGIEPKLSALEYLDLGKYENELKQILGDIHSSTDIDSESVLIIGREGLLAAGPGFKNCDDFLTEYVALLSRQIFVHNFFIRTFVLDDTLSKIRELIINYTSDPNSMRKIRGLLNASSRDIILLQELLGYLKESLENFNLLQAPQDKPIACTIAKVCDSKGLKNEIQMRCNDLEKLLEGSRHQLLNLEQMTSGINSKQLEEVFRNVEANTKYLVDASDSSARASASLEVMQVVLAGSFTFSIIDRISGGTLNIVVPQWFNTMFVETIISKPFMWFFLNILWFLLMSFFLIRLMRKLAANASGHLTLRGVINRKINVGKLLDYIENYKKVDITDSVVEPTTNLLKFGWCENDTKLWQGSKPKIEILLDEKNKYLLSVFFQIDAKKTSLRESGLTNLFYQELEMHGVFLEEKNVNTNNDDSSIQKPEEEEKDNKNTGEKGEKYKILDEVDQQLKKRKSAKVVPIEE